MTAHETETRQLIATILAGLLAGRDLSETPVGGPEFQDLYNYASQAAHVINAAANRQ